MWADVRNHWQYIVGLFLYCILLVLPLYINIDNISSSFTGTTNQIVHLAIFYYVISSLCNIYFLCKAVALPKILFYIGFIIAFGILNPYEILTTVFPMMYSYYIVLLLMVLLILFKKDIITTIIVFFLTIAGQMTLFSFSVKPSYWIVATTAVYLIGYYLFFDQTPVSVSGIINRVRTALNRPRTSPFQFIYNLTTLERSGIFLVISGILLFLFIRTASKEYYGGEILVNDPISITEVRTFPIEATFHSSLSCWVYLNPSTRTDNDTLFLYGDQLLVSYEADVNSLRIRLKDDISYIERKALLQKWNHIAFVYDHGRIVLYLNGEVIHSSEWSPPSFTNELLFGRLQGKICHVRYYKEALEERVIESLYEYFKNKNPPII
jgi:hypothetical protein